VAPVRPGGPGRRGRAGAKEDDRPAAGERPRAAARGVPERATARSWREAAIRDGETSRPWPKPPDGGPARPCRPPGRGRGTLRARAARRSGGARHGRPVPYRLPVPVTSVRRGGGEDRCDGNAYPAVIFVASDRFPIAPRVV